MSEPDQTTAARTRRSSGSSSEQTEATSVEGGSGDDEIQYIDYGDRTLVIDNRGPVQRREFIPKSARDIAVATGLRQELEQRIEAEVVAPQKLAEEQASDPHANLPPAETDEERQKREKEADEALQKADQQQAQSAEEHQQDVAAGNP